MGRAHGATVTGSPPPDDPPKPNGPPEEAGDGGSPRASVQTVQKRSRTREEREKRRKAAERRAMRRRRMDPGAEAPAPPPASALPPAPAAAAPAPERPAPPAAVAPPPGSGAAATGAPPTPPAPARRLPPGAFGQAPDPGSASAPAPAPPPPRRMPAGAYGEAAPPAAPAPPPAAPESPPAVPEAAPAPPEDPPPAADAAPAVAPAPAPTAPAKPSRVGKRKKARASEAAPTPTAPPTKGPAKPEKKYEYRAPLRARHARVRRPIEDPELEEEATEEVEEAAELEVLPIAGVPPGRLVAVVLALLVAPFLLKPVHLDDTNFLALARGARLDPWRPHNVHINWQGTTERAFDVLSNPPGVGWWLAPVVDLPVWAMHLWMVPWLGLAAWGAWRLGARFVQRPALATLFICASPIGLLSAHALMPDLPLLACSLAGAAGLVSGPARRTWPWALLLGASALFRYSGLAFVPLAFLWGALERDWKGAGSAALAAATPFCLLAGHDLLAYGAVHFTAMMDFQGVSTTARDFGRKALAAIAMLGTAGLLPLLCWRRPGGALLGLFAGVGLGLFAAALSHHTGFALVTTVLALGAGGAAMGGAITSGLRAGDREAWWLLAWAVGGFLFLLQLRFTAARYWLPFLAPWVLLALREAGPRVTRTAVAGTLALAALLALSDQRLARAQKALANRVLSMADGETGLVAGHWGWQHHLEAAGWTPLEDDQPVPFGMLVATSTVSWPQEPGPGCFSEVGAFAAPTATLPLPRVHTTDGGANLHAFVISGRPPMETYAAWSFGFEPLDRVVVQRSCGPR
jgi:hypothetical protein